VRIYYQEICEDLLIMGSDVHERLACKVLDMERSSNA
jgi:hypothetical protein